MSRNRLERFERLELFEPFIDLLRTAVARAIESARRISHRSGTSPNLLPTGSRTLNVKGKDAIPLRPPRCDPATFPCSFRHLKGKETAEEEKFRDYYDYSEAIRTIPSHRALALFRGQGLGVLKIELGLGEEIEVAAVLHPCVAMIAAHFGIEDRGRPADKWLADVCHWTWRIKAHLHFRTASSLFPTCGRT